MAMNLIARVIVIALVLIASSIGKPPVEKVCCLKEKTCHSSSCRGRIIALNVEMARVAEVEQGILYMNSTTCNYEKGTISARARCLPILPH